jgi:hypothetical protein
MVRIVRSLCSVITQMKQCVREVHASARPISVTMESAVLEIFVSIGYILATELTIL